MTDRERFESWAKSMGWFPTKLASGEYRSPHLQDCYEAWQAATEQANQELRHLQRKVEQAKQEIRHLERKVAHGCTDANCEECDK